jgi:hypothetical protein
VSGDGALPTVVISMEDDPPPPRRAIAVRVLPLVVPEASPPLAAWTVVVYLPNGEWRETFGDEGKLDAFIRGARAASTALGYGVEVDQ